MWGPRARPCSCRVGSSRIGPPEPGAGGRCRGHVGDRSPSISSPGLARGAAGGPATILVIDDDPVQVAATAQMLSALGHRVLVAHGWVEALHVFDDEVVDLVLMDAVMPTVDGFKLTRILRGRMERYVPIVFLTALSNREARERGIVVGADDFLTKPLRPVELSVRVAAMLRIRHLTKVLEAKSAELDRLVNLDPLTGIGNRRAFDRALAHEWERAGRYGHPLSVALFDLDGFKAVNDTFGHAAGDELLACFSRLLDTEARPPVQVFRFGGEEFVALLPHAGEARAWNFAQCVRRAFETKTAGEGAVGRRTVSAGVSASADPHVHSRSLLLERADRALYRAKGAGRNRVMRGSELDVAGGEAGLRSTGS